MVRKNNGLRIVLKTERISARDHIPVLLNDPIIDSVATVQALGKFVVVKILQGSFESKMSHDLERHLPVLRHEHCDDQTEDVRPVPKSSAKQTKPIPVVATPPDPFLSAFHDRAKELLSADDYALIKEMAMTKEEAASGC